MNDINRNDLKILFTKKYHIMVDEYNKWIISKNLDDKKKSLGNCLNYTKMMHNEYPWLRSKYGTVVTLEGDFKHHWLVDVNGEIVDPTKSQFSKILEYIVDDNPYDVKKCMNCGSLFEYDNNHKYTNLSCSKNCYEILDKILGK